MGLISRSQSQNSDSAQVCAPLGHSLIVEAVMIIMRYAVQEMVDRCEPNPCPHVCLDYGDRVVCECSHGFTGTTSWVYNNALQLATSYFCRAAYVCLCVYDFSWCLLATFRKNFWSDTRKKLTTDVSLDKEEQFKFWKSSVGYLHQMMFDIAKAYAGN